MNSLEYTGTIFSLKTICHGFICRGQALPVLLLYIKRTLFATFASTWPPQQHETMPLPRPFHSTQLMGNWSRLERSPVQRYQGWEGGVNSGRDASEVKPLIMITNWSWLLERQAAAVGRPAFEVPPACCRVPGPLAWGDAGTMWLPVGKNVMRRQGDGARDGCNADGLAGHAGGLWVERLGPLRMAHWDEGEGLRLCALCCHGISLSSLVTHTHRLRGAKISERLCGCSALYVYLFIFRMCRVNDEYRKYCLHNHANNLSHRSLNWHWKTAMFLRMI